MAADGELSARDHAKRFEAFAGKHKLLDVKPSEPPDAALVRRSLNGHAFRTESDDGVRADLNRYIQTRQGRSDNAETIANVKHDARILFGKEYARRLEGDQRWCD